MLRQAGFYNRAMLGGYHVAVRHAIESCFFSRSDGVGLRFIDGMI